MELLSQHTKAIMEECKIRASDAGLKFDSESLEYIVTNRDMLELSPKVMIPTLYDYWVNDVEVLKGKGLYKAYPHNPYETVINSRPAISFYNDNNPDWMNIMIFYHVLGHIDFFQNNILFAGTWNDDFVGQALADKRLIESLRSEYGRWVDYIIEFSRSIDNLVGFFNLLQKSDYPKKLNPPEKTGFFFDIFLQQIVKVPEHEIYRYLEKYNSLVTKDRENGEDLFFSEIKLKYPEFEAKFERHFNEKHDDYIDLPDFILNNSPFLQKDCNEWMKSVLSIVRNTSLYFSPQIRTKIINEGWASYWHDELFRKDERIKGHEVAFAILNANVTSISRIGLNPYAIGLRLIQYVEKLADKGMMSFDFQKLENKEIIQNFDKQTNKGKDAIFSLRKNFSDFTLINTFVSQDFVDEHNLFVVGKRLNEQRGTIEYYIKSRKAEDYKEMLNESLYHPPKIAVDRNLTNDGNLYLIHEFEGKQLFKDYISDTLLGIEFLWGGQAQIETTEIVIKQSASGEQEKELRKVLYTMKNRKLNKQNL